MSQRIWGPTLVMTLRTPRRRISPRTKRRYRAIREFFRRALGSTSQQEIKINSSIAVNVTDLKRKIVGLEHQLDEVNKHCRDFAYLEEDCSRNDSENFMHYDFRHEIDTIKEQTEVSSERKSSGFETQLLYKPSDGSKKKLNHRDNLIKLDFDKNLMENRIPLNGYVNEDTQIHTKNTKSHHNSNASSKLHKHKARSVYDNTLSARSTSSFHSLANTRVKDDADYAFNSNIRKPSKKDVYRDINPQQAKDKKYKDFVQRNKILYEDKLTKHRKEKQFERDLDPDFIADIIQKQYKPVKMFGRKESEFSQFSAPICRDQEFSIKENIQEGSELCSCLYPDASRRITRLKYQDLGEMRSVCDTRLYSSSKHTRRKHRRVHVDTCSNSDMYDFIPVKERSSPKSRRKFAEANMIPCEYYREVPPSPRTLRPRLNLKAQYYTELEDYMAHAKRKYRRHQPQRQKVYAVNLENYEADIASEFILEKNKPQNLQKYLHVPVAQIQLQEQCQQPGTLSSLKNSQYNNDQTGIPVDTTLNKTQETEINIDKTDKALCEIKDILQNFLHEIKKETVTSQCDKSDITCKTRDNDSNFLQDPGTKINSNVMPNSTSYNNYNLGQCGTPYMPPFPTNPCCYPVLPVCPINCPMPLQSGGYVIPSPSFTCANCVNVPKESFSSHCCNKNTEIACNTETDELIKEIYNMVAKGPVGKKVPDSTNSKKHDVRKTEEKILTSRSVGGSNKNYQHDAKVGTQPLKCYSKSCEAIGSRMVSETYYSGTNVSYSDTLLEKLSLEAGTHSASESELDTSNTEQDKNKGNKFSKVLRSIGLFKKKKKEVIEEVSETESVTETDLKPKPPVFRQHVTNYMMHGQEYYEQPPNPHYDRNLDYNRRPNDYRSGAYEYAPTPRDHGVRAQDYQRINEYQSRPHEHQPRRHGHQPKPHDPRPNEFEHRPHEYQPDYHPPYNPGMRGYPSPQLSDPYGQMHSQRNLRTRNHPRGPHSPARQQPASPPYSTSYDTSYSQMQPPLCLKEVEVKSTGTQSERKMSIFRKFKKKVHQPVVITHMAAAGDQRSFSTQTAGTTTQGMKRPPQKITKPLINWKKLQAKAMQAIPQPDLDPMAYSYKTQQELAHGNLKIRNAMLKKIFYKRNPFSPRNLIVKTLLGRDKSSFGDAPGMLRPRMFF